MTAKKTCVVLVGVLTAYLLGYVACRGSRVFVHTASILNLDFEGRYHMIHVADNTSPFARLAGKAYWPLREIEARLYKSETR